LHRHSFGVIIFKLNIRKGENGMQTLTVILGIVLILSSIVLIAVILLQPGKSAGLSGAITGGAETFFGRNKAKSYEGKLVLATKIFTGVIFAVSLALVILARFTAT
jgi:preprotein translocase subunit SecG